MFTFTESNENIRGRGIYEGDRCEWPATGDSGPTARELGEGTFGWQENINNSFDEGTFSTLILGIDTPSTFIGDTGNGRARYGNNWSVVKKVKYGIHSENIVLVETKYFLNIGL